MRTLNKLINGDIFKEIKPIPLILSFYIFGIIFYRFTENDSINLFCLIITLFILSIISYFKRWPITLTLLLALFFLIGLLNTSLHLNPHQNNHISHFVSENKITVTGTILDKENYPHSNKISLKIIAREVQEKHKKYKTSGLILLNAHQIEKVFNYGDKIRVTGKLKKPGKPYNFGDFNYELFLAEKSIFATMDVWSSQMIEILDYEIINIFVSFSHLVRNRIKDIMGKILPQSHQSLIIGMMLGEKSLISEDLKDTFINSGAMHILAVSGLHVGILAGFLLFIFNRFKCLKNIKYSAVLLVIFFYVSITGYRPSVIRAATMFSIIIIGKMINRRGNILNSLFFAAFIILLLNPLTLYNSGFLLSFFVTFFIIYLVPVISEKFSTGIVWLNNSMAISLSAWLGIFPLSAYFFNKVSIIALISNLFVVPLAGAVIILGFIIFLIGLINIHLALFFTFSLNILLNFLVKLIELFSSLPFSFVYMGQPSMIAIILYYIFLIGIIEIAVKRRLDQKIGKKLAMAALLIIIIAISFNIFLIKDEIEVHFLNVGEGDCALIQIPNNINILIDGGGSANSDFDVGEKIVIPYLLRNGIRKLDLIVLTHPHLDHLEGLLPVLKDFEVKMVLDNKIDCKIKEYKEFLSIIQKKQIPYQQAEKGDILRINQNVEILVLHPEVKKKNIIDSEDFNNQSIVLKLCYKNDSFLFTGDIEEEAEHDIMSWNNILNSDVLKVAHHGSDTSTGINFLQKVDPLIAIISTGKNNFGHPSSKVIKTIEKNGTRIFRTDTDGTIVIKSNGHNYSISVSRRS